MLDFSVDFHRWPTNEGRIENAFRLPWRPRPRLCDRPRAGARACPRTCPLFFCCCALFCPLPRPRDALRTAADPLRVLHSKNERKSRCRLLSKFVVVMSEGNSIGLPWAWSCNFLSSTGICISTICHLIANIILTRFDNASASNSILCILSIVRIGLTSNTQSRIDRSDFTQIWSAATSNQSITCIYCWFGCCGGYTVATATAWTLPWLSTLTWCRSTTLSILNICKILFGISSRQIWTTSTRRAGSWTRTCLQWSVACTRSSTFAETIQDADIGVVAIQTTASTANRLIDQLRFSSVEGEWNYGDGVSIRYKNSIFEIRKHKNVIILHAAISTKSQANKSQSKRSSKENFLSIWNCFFLRNFSSLCLSLHFLCFAFISIATSTQLFNKKVLIVYSCFVLTL